MAKAKSASNDVSVQILDSLLALQKGAQKLDLSKFQTREGVAARGIEICPIYLKIRPYLEIVKNLPLIPKKIRDGIGLLMTALDTMCPVR